MEERGFRLGTLGLRGECLVLPGSRSVATLSFYTRLGAGLRAQARKFLLLLGKNHETVSVVTAQESAW